MFGLGIQELIVIIIVILLLIDHKKIPEFTRGVGKVYREFKKAQESIKDELMREEIKLDTPNNEQDTRESDSKQNVDSNMTEGENGRTGRAG